MKLLVLANRDVHANYALNLLLPQLGNHRVHLWLSSEVGSTSKGHPTLQTLRFFEQTLFNELLFPLLGPPAGEALSNFYHLSSYLVQEPLVCNDINSNRCLAELAELAPDLIVSIRYGRILRPPAIAAARLGVINLHSGKLPAYRGVMATFWAMLAGEERIGTTLHWIQDAGIDTGDIIGTTDQAISPSRSYLGNVLDLYPQGCELIAAAITTLAEGKLLPQRQTQTDTGAYFSFPDEVALAGFAQRGFRLYDETEVTALARRYLDP